MMVATNKAKSTAKVNLLGRTALPTTVTFSTIILKDMANTTGQTAEPMLACGKTTRWKAVESLTGPTVVNTKANM